VLDHICRTFKGRRLVLQPDLDQLERSDDKRLGRSRQETRHDRYALRRLFLPVVGQYASPESISSN
jgi:hypothetical protein